MSEMEQRIRDRLADLALDAPSHLSVPPDLASRSHRRGAQVMAIAALVTVVVVFGAVTGVRALIRAEGPLMPANPGTGVHLGSTGTGRITVVASGRRVIDVDPETGSTRHIAVPKFEHLLAWSPDGSRLLFSGVGHLDVLEPDGSVVAVEDTGASDPSEGSWSPDGSQIVYMTDMGEKGFPLRVINADGSGVVAEYGGAATDGRFPAWSPDGSTIAFLGGTFDRPELWLIGADGSDPRMIVGCGPSGACPTWTPLPWSPDGTRLAFSGLFGNGAQIYTVDVGGSDLTRLTDVAFRAGSPSWSPDGTGIAFTVGTGTTANPRCACRFTLELMDADGSNIRSLDVEVAPSSPVMWHAVRSA
jgi:Tol biopolymer transport system component